MNFDPILVVSLTDETLITRWSIWGVGGFVILFVGLGIGIKLFHKIPKYLARVFSGRTSSFFSDWADRANEKMHFPGLFIIFIASPFVALGTWVESLEVTRTNLKSAGLWGNEASVNLESVVKLTVGCNRKLYSRPSRFWLLTLQDGTTVDYRPKDIVWSSLPALVIFLRANGIEVDEQCKSN